MRTVILPLALLLAAPVLSAQNEYPITTLLLEGDPVAGVGNITHVDNLTVSDSGGWAVEVDTDNSDTTADGAVIENGALFLREGQSLPLPSGATLSSVDALYFRAFDGIDRLTCNFFLKGTTGGMDDSGIYTDTDLLIQEGDVTGAPQLSAGTPYTGFFEVKPNQTHKALIMASVDDPAIATSTDRALIVMEDDGAGTLLSESAIAWESQVLPGQTEAVTDFQTGPHDYAFNDAGVGMFVASLTGSTAFNTAIYLSDGTNYAKLAQKGTATSVSPTREWSSLTSAVVDLTDGVDFSHDLTAPWVFVGSLTGDSSSNVILVKNTSHGERKLVQEGDILSGTGGFPLTSLGFGPVCIGNNGNVLFYGDWADPDTSKDTGLFLNGKLIVQEGVTTIGGVTVNALRGIQDGYTLSRDGRYVVFEAELVGGLEGAFMIDTGAAWANLDSWLSPSVLAAVEPGAAICGYGIGSLGPSTPVTLGLANAPASTPATLIASPFVLDAPFKGGFLVPFPTLLLGLGTTSADGTLAVPLLWPGSLPSGLTFTMQWWLPDADGPVGVVASNAFSGTTP